MCYQDFFYSERVETAFPKPSSRVVPRQPVYGCGLGQRGPHLLRWQSPVLIRRGRTVPSLAFVSRSSGEPPVFGGLVPKSVGSCHSLGAQAVSGGPEAMALAVGARFGYHVKRVGS